MRSALRLATVLRRRGVVAAATFEPIGSVEDFVITRDDKFVVFDNSIGNGPTRNLYLERIGYAMRRVGHYAISGSEVNEWITAFDGMVADALAGNIEWPDQVDLGGFENDTTHGLTANAIINPYQYMMNKARTVLGARISVRWKIDNWGMGSPTDAARAEQVYAWLLGRQGSDCIILDSGRDYQTSMGGQGPSNGHPSHRGGWIYGDYMAADSLPRITGDPLLPASGNVGSNLNRHTNWNHTGTAGSLTNVTGTLSTGFTATNTSGATVVASQGTVTSGDAADVLTVSGMSTGGYVSYVCTAPASAKAGEYWEWLIEYELADSDGTTDPKSVYRIAANDDGNGSNVGVLFTSSSDDYQDEDIPARKSVLRVGAVLGADIATPRIQVKFFMAARAADYVLKIGRVVCQPRPDHPANRVVTLDTFSGANESGTVNFVARRLNTKGAASVQYAVTGTGVDPASASDFTGGVFPSGTLNFADGSATAAGSFTFVDDALDEGDEGFLLTLSNPSAGYTLGSPSSQAATIIDNDGGVVYDSDAEVAFLRMSTAPSATMKGIISDLITTLKAPGTSGTNKFAKMITLRYFPAEAAQQTRVNLAQNAYDFNVLGTGPTFAAGQGVTGTGVAANGYESTYAGAGRQNDFHVGIWTRSTAVCAASLTSLGSIVSLNPRAAGDIISGRCMSDLTQTNASSITTAAGHTLYNRTGSTGYTAYRNASPFAFTSRSSTFTGIGAERIFSGATTGQLVFEHMGLSLNAAEIVDIHAALQTAGQAAGAF
jgi:hypothetical protein